MWDPKLRLPDTNNKSLYSAIGTVACVCIFEKSDWGGSDLESNCIHGSGDSFRPFFMLNQIWIFCGSVEKREKSSEWTFRKCDLSASQLYGQKVGLLGTIRILNIG